MKRLLVPILAGVMATSAISCDKCSLDNLRFPDEETEIKPEPEENFNNNSTIDNKCEEVDLISGIYEGTIY